MEYRTPTLATTRRLREILAITILSALATIAFADDASQFSAPPPALYKDQLSKLLTPLDDVIKKASDSNQQQGDGIVLLDETVTFVNDDGKRVSVYHSIDKAWNDSGVRSMAQDTFTFKKSSQKAYLVSAVTIQPDGTRSPVKPDAVFLKTPQDEADDAVYDDESEMVVVFSNVKPGSVTESIIVLEGEPKIPGQYTQTYTWNGAWPEYMQRLVIDLPKSFADRLKISNLGQDVPTPVTTTPSPLRTQLTWQKLNTPGDPAPQSQAPSLQMGPLVWVTTLDSWDTFAAWYSGLIKGTDSLDPELKKKIDAWTKDAKSHAEILAILYSHVARDVRYTGFELGKSDLQPHECSRVWDQQYGDCKDKANLLRAMLTYKGIPAWLTLLSTEHAGAVNKSAPDFRQFNHCIVTVKIGDTQVICDPTITYGIPGLLSGSEADRDVLVIKGDKGEWTHTPAFHDASVAYNFDLQLRPSGELSGWVDLKATGYYSASYLKSFQGLTKEQTLSSLQDDIRSIFPNSSVVDFEPLKDTSSAGNDTAIPPFSIRAYMVLTGVLNQGEATAQLKFPGPDILLPDISDYKTRQHSTFTWPDTQLISCRIQLPDGWNAPNLPLPIQYDSSGGSFQASWAADKDALTATCTVTIKQSLFSADDMKTLGDAFTNLQSWASKALTIAKSDKAPATPAAATSDADLAANLPVMPTGEGQLNLIDSEFPHDGNVVARRAALNRIPTLFPSDQKSIVEAAIKLGALDLDDGKPAGVAAKLQPIIDANRAVLDVDTIAWADYVIASALRDDGKKPEALVVFQKIAENASVGPGHRGWAIYESADLMADKTPDAALAYLEKGFSFESDALPSIYGSYASIGVSNGHTDKVNEQLTKLIASKPDKLEDILIEVSNSAEALIESGHKKEGLDLVTLLESLSDPATTGDSFARALKKIRTGADSIAVCAKLQQDLKQALAQFPDIAALEKKQPPFSSVSDAEKSESQHEDNNEPDDALGCALHLAIGYPADAKFPAYYWDCFRFAEWDMRNIAGPSKEPFFQKLAELGDELPHTSDDYVEVKLLQAKVLEKKGQRTEAGQIYDALSKQADLPDGYQGSLTLRSGNNWAEQGDYVKALACYAPAEAAVNNQSTAQDAVLSAAFIQFDNGNTAEALRLVHLLSDAVQKNKIKPGEQIKDVVAVVDGTTDTPAFWNNWHSWWPKWQALETAAGLEPIKDQKVIPIIPSLLDLGKELGMAKKNNDTKQFFELMRQIAYASRFYPNAAQEFVGVFSLAEEVLPDHANDLRLLAISILEPMAPTDPKDQRVRILDLLANYADTNQNDQAMDLMTHTWKPALEDNSLVTQAIHRVWALVAVRKHQDLDKVREALEKDLQANPDANNTTAAGLLADVYLALGLQANAIQLLETELKNPAVIADTASQQELKARLDNIQNSSEDSKHLAEGVAAWLKDQKPAWWDYAEPKSADDPRLARLDEILKNPNGEMLTPELIKAGLLAPSTTALSAASQQNAVLKSFVSLLGISTTQDQADALAKSVLNNPSFSQSLKADFLYFYLLDAYGNRRPDSYATFSQLPLYQSLPPGEKAYADRIGAFIKVDSTSSAALNANVQDMAKHPLDTLDIACIQDTVAYLMQLGDTDSIKALYQASANFTVAPTATTTKPELQLSLLKQLNYATAIKPTIDAFRQTILAAYKPESISAPAGFAQRRNLTTFNDLSPEDATNMRLYLIKMHREPFDLSFWYYLMRDLPHNAAGAEINLSLLKAAFDTSADDDQKASFVSFGTATLDLDNPSLRAKFMDLLKPYRDPVKFPHTTENIRMVDVSMALRDGTPVNLATELTGLTSSQNVQEAGRLQVRAYLQAKDWPKLKATLNGLSADQLMSPGLILETLPALEAAGMKDEAMLARDTLNKKLYQDVLTGWFSPDGGNLQSVAADIQGLGSTKDIPNDFSAFAESHVARPQAVLDYKLFKAYYEKDWNTSSAVGTTYTQNYPTFYTQYWFLGRSLAELGKKEEAIKALTVYCQYSHDEVWYPEAKSLLDSLSAPQK
jgi:hypothetical protein